MPTICKEINQQQNLTIFSVAGEISAQGLQEAVRRFYHETTTANSLWDLSRSDLRKVETNAFAVLAQTPEKQTGRAGIGRTAIVTGPSNLTYGLFRAFEIASHCEVHHIEHRTFRSMDQAIRWLSHKRQETIVTNVCNEQDCSHSATPRHPG